MHLIHSRNKTHSVSRMRSKWTDRTLHVGLMPRSRCEWDQHTLSLAQSADGRTFSLWGDRKAAYVLCAVFVPCVCESVPLTHRHNVPTEKRTKTTCTQFTPSTQETLSANCTNRWNKYILHAISNFRSGQFPLGFTQQVSHAVHWAVMTVQGDPTTHINRCINCQWSPQPLCPKLCQSQRVLNYSHGGGKANAQSLVQIGLYCPCNSTRNT